MLIIFLISLCSIVVQSAWPQDPCWLVCDEFSAARNGTGFDLCGPSASRCDETTYTCTFLYWSRAEDGQEGLINSEVEQDLTEEELANPLTCRDARQTVAHRLGGQTPRQRRVIGVTTTTAHPPRNYIRESLYNSSTTNGTFSRHNTTVRRVVPIFTSTGPSLLPMVHTEKQSDETVLESSSLPTVHKEKPLYEALPELTSSYSLSPLRDQAGISFFNVPGFDNGKRPPFNPVVKGRPTKSPRDEESNDI